MSTIAGPTAAEGKTSKGKMRPTGQGTMLGAIFLMATSAIGPGFITQTTTFTVRLTAAFAFAIMVSVIVDIAVQLNVWRVIGVSGQRANALGNAVLPGLGWFLGIMVALGGLVFNVGNIAGGGLGLNAIFDLDARVGGIITAAIGIAIFLWKAAGKVMDRMVIVLGAVMILLMLYVTIISHPPYGEALRQMILPERVEFLTITTLIGGTVGGYITYSGAHRMLDSDRTGPEHVREVSNASILGVCVTGVMRFLLFLAILGVVTQGAKLTGAANPSAAAFEFAAGKLGLRLFGVILWGASITSVIGAAFTSVSFLTKASTPQRTRNLITVVFILVSSVVYIAVGKAPTTLLIVAGAVNGLILPIGFAIMLWVAWRRRDLMQGYVYPKWLLIIGVLVWLLTIYLGWRSLEGLAALWRG